MANMQELAKDKWLCPLSGKKFKGPEFVRKHIIAKHMDKVDEVKQEVKDTIYNYDVLCMFSFSAGLVCEEIRMLLLITLLYHATL